MKKMSWIIAVMCLAFAAGTGRCAAAPAAQQETPRKKLDVLTYHIPENLATVKDRHVGSSGKTVIYIQDAHCNFEAQSNNAKILEDLVKNQNFALVAVEGSTGLIDTAPFSQFPDKDIKNEVATYFMKKGRITGPEFLSITSDLPFTIWGIEDETAYKENYDAFVKTVNTREQIKGTLALLGRDLDTLKKNIFSPALKEIDSRMRDYRDNKIQFIDWAQYLTARAKALRIGLDKYPNFNQQNRVVEFEAKIDFNKVDAERGALVDIITKKLGKDKLSELVAKSLAFRLGKIPADEYYGALKGLAAAAKIDFAQYKNLAMYTEYLGLLKNIKTSELITECDRLADDVKSRSFATDDERAVDRTGKDLSTLETLFELTLSPADYQHFEDNRFRTTAAAIAKEIGRFAQRYGLSVPPAQDLNTVDSNIGVAEYFYSMAKKRDALLVRNTENKMAEDKAEQAVLVTGGFHTEGIASILRDKGFSYIVITPRITNPNAENPYLDVMLNKKTPFEELLMSSESSNK